MVKKALKEFKSPVFEIDSEVYVYAKTYQDTGSTFENDRPYIKVKIVAITHEITYCSNSFNNIWYLVKTEGGKPKEVHQDDVFSTKSDIINHVRAIIRKDWTRTKNKLEYLTGILTDLSSEGE